MGAMAPMAIAPGWSADQNGLEPVPAHRLARSEAALANAAAGL